MRYEEGGKEGEVGSATGAAGESWGDRTKGGAKKKKTSGGMGGLSREKSPAVRKVRKFGGVGSPTLWTGFIKKGQADKSNSEAANKGPGRFGGSYGWVCGWSKTERSHF